jgi:2-oxo-4-hydroxy-4-carboxy-5-ureidoimidazoline decarboxylase
LASSHRAVAPERADGFADVKPRPARIALVNRREISGEYRGAMLLDEFNAADASAAASVVGVWAAIPAWVDAVVDGRPYASVDALTSRAAALADGWSVADLDAALAHHPRIGQRPTGAGAEAAASRREQASMTDAAAGVTAAIAAGNAAYEQRFGRVFLIRAAGRAPEQILTELQRRLRNDDRAEAAEALAQLAEIAILRLRASVTDAQSERIAP